ncbi:ATP-dependent sacrificial sulfur transferase LarE [Methanobacterium alcaliphilum]|uniref:ATP-dependent sacrificial sulfur transferase LarE n=1 Tax=Methanobacterium alcaliphilum TaxID=392018 RepID=UPI00200B21E4|nr:ATP-dependent sacrificial sulfur transferase LarE [Methanobacterium alcaliphilum]MCK9150348.1 ATP-dependent sacrificial sulfur transferase LarE [Methanobacterium alcaliphilum]
MELDKKLEEVKNILKAKKIIIAFSGGADSTLLAYIASQVTEKALAVTIDNGVMPNECSRNAKKIAEKIGIDHVIIKEDFLDDDLFKENNPNRCFICKNKMYHKLQEIAQKEEYPLVVDGTNISDLLEDRPGIMVNYQKNISSPLVTAGLTKEDVLKILESEKISYSLSTTCLATRLSSGDEITPKKINRISYAESLLKSLSKAQIIRVRDQNGVAQIQIDKMDSLLNSETLNHIDSELKAVGFKRVTLDIGEYGESKNDLVIYKPCKAEKNKIMFERELPYEIDIENTCNELKSIGAVKCSESMGIAMLEVENQNVTIFKKGKIVARKVKNQEDAEKLLIKVLPAIRRSIF